MNTQVLLKGNYRTDTLLSKVNINQSSTYQRLCAKEATIALVGLGYVGLPIALEFAKSFKTIGFDINGSRIDLMKKGIDPSGELESADFEHKDHSRCIYIYILKSMNCCFLIYKNYAIHYYNFSTKFSFT